MFLLPLHTQRQGKKKFLSPATQSLFLHPTCPRNPATTHVHTCRASNSPAHLTLRHDKGKVALSSSAYKYQRRGCRKKEEGENRGSFLEERSRNRGKEGKQIVEKTKEGRVFWVVENIKKKLGGKGILNKRRERDREQSERIQKKKKQRKKRENKKNHHLLPSARQRHRCSSSPPPPVAPSRETKEDSRNRKKKQ